jgi:allophanate hydrolase
MESPTLEQARARITADAGNPAWIHLATPAAPGDGPLSGVLFGVKDNIDVAGMPTTAACPGYAYEPAASAHAVQRLVDAGGVVMGKTNLDQFATGLVGTRSPYGVCHNVFAPEYLSGGSSSGSAVAVARGHVAFALGTDTAGSGRVPAALNGLVGYKPTKGLISTRGVVPACRSQDCVSVFTRTAHEAAEIAQIVRGYDELDPYSRAMPADAPLSRAWADTVVGLVPAGYLQANCSAEVIALYGGAVQCIRALGGKTVEIDFAPFASTARLLYEGPWVAERYAGVGDFVEGEQEGLDPTVTAIIRAARDLKAVDAFKSFYKLQDLAAQAAKQWAKMLVLLVPTIPALYSIAEVTAEPVKLNSHYGIFNNFVNLLDLSAVTISTARFAAGPGFGVTLIGPAFHDDALLALGAEYLGEPPLPFAVREDEVHLAVVGAHLRGLPLHHQLTELNARFVRTAKTAACYKLIALPGTVPPKPGMIQAKEGGGSIELEVYALSPAAFGGFVAKIPAPLGIGTVMLDDGTQVKCFLCEAVAAEGAEDITHFGGWRGFMRR